MAFLRIADKTQIPALYFPFSVSLLFIRQGWHQTLSVFVFQLISGKREGGHFLDGGGNPERDWGSDLNNTEADFQGISIM